MAEKDKYQEMHLELQNQNIRTVITELSLSDKGV